MCFFPILSVGTNQSFQESHSFSFSSHYAHGITTVIYHPGHRLVFPLLPANNMDMVNEGGKLNIEMFWIRRVRGKKKGILILVFCELVVTSQVSLYLCVPMEEALVDLTLLREYWKLSYVLYCLNTLCKQRFL